MNPDYLALIIARLLNDAEITSTDRFALRKWAEAASVERLAALDALKDAEAFIDRHSEPWYITGQELLAKVRASLPLEVQP